MSAPFGLNALTFSDVTRQLRLTFETFTDQRTGKNTGYTMTDAGLSALSVFSCKARPFWTSSGRCRKLKGKKMPKPCLACSKSRRTTTSAACLTGWNPRRRNRCLILSLTVCSVPGSSTPFGHRTTGCCWPWTAPSTIRHPSCMARAVPARPTATAKPAIRIRW